MDHTLVVDRQGRLYVGGCNTFGQLGIDGKVAGKRPYKRIEFFDGIQTKAKRAQGGMNFSVVLSQSGQLYSTGLAENGRLGLGSIMSRQVSEFTLLKFFTDIPLKVEDFCVGGKNVLAWSEKEAL